MRDVASADLTGSTFESCSAVRVVCSGPLTCYSTLWLAPLSRSTYTILSMFSLGKFVVENNFLDKSRSTHTLQPKPRTARCPWSWIRCAGLPVVMMMIKCSSVNGGTGMMIYLRPATATTTTATVGDVRMQGVSVLSNHHSTYSSQILLIAQQVAHRTYSRIPLIAP